MRGVTWSDLCYLSIFPARAWRMSWRGGEEAGAESWPEWWWPSQGSSLEVNRGGLFKCCFGVRIETEGRTGHVRKEVPRAPRFLAWQQLPSLGTGAPRCKEAGMPTCLSPLDLMLVGTARARTHTHAHAHAHTHTCTRAHTHTHTCTHTPRCKAGNANLPLTPGPNVSGDC